MRTSLAREASFSSEVDVSSRYMRPWEESQKSNEPLQAGLRNLLPETGLSLIAEREVVSCWRSLYSGSRSISDFWFLPLHPEPFLMGREVAAENTHFHRRSGGLNGSQNSLRRRTLPS